MEKKNTFELIHSFIVSVNLRALSPAFTLTQVWNVCQENLAIWVSRDWNGAFIGAGHAHGRTEVGGWNVAVKLNTCTP